MSTIKETIRQLKEQRDRAVSDANRFITLNDALIEDCEELQNKLERAETLWKATTKTLQDEIDRLTKELDNERQQHSEAAAAWSDEQCKCNRLCAENEKLKKALDSACESMGVCEERYTLLIQKLHSEIDQLTVELRDERDRFDKLTSYELEQNKMLQEAKAKAKRGELIYNTVMRILERDGYDVLSLFIKTGFTVAAVEMKEQNDRH